jgi:sulfur-oxidizing protein SoxY
VRQNKHCPNKNQPTRRVVLNGLTGAAALAAVGNTLVTARAETQNMNISQDMDAAIRLFSRGSPLGQGKVKLDISPLVENGNSVSIGVEVDHPMTTDAYVRRIGLFNEKNPQPEIAVFHFSARSGSSKTATRIRLATTQHLAAVAELSDGSFWMDRVEVIVTIAACMEE